MYFLRVNKTYIMQIYICKIYKYMYIYNAYICIHIYSHKINLPNKSCPKEDINL